jgi:hypothetical protein
VGDIPAGDGIIENLFFTVYISLQCVEGGLRSSDSKTNFLVNHLNEIRIATFTCFYCKLMLKTLYCPEPC